MSGQLLEGAVVYKVGLMYLSVCHPRGMPLDDVLDQVNREHPTGLDHGWNISTDRTFSGGEPNPCTCNSDQDRMHRLLSC